MTQKAPEGCGAYCVIANNSENGAGGNRTPVPRRPERRFYACSRWFDLNPRPAIDSLRWVQFPVKFSPLHPRERRESASLLSLNPALAGVGRGSGCLNLRLPVRTACWQLLCVRGVLRGLHAPRRATPNLSSSGRNHIGPRCQTGASRWTPGHTTPPDGSRFALRVGAVRTLHGVRARANPAITAGQI